MPTGTFVYTGAGKKLNDGETDPCLINKTCRRLACDIQWCRELYLGADVHRQHTDVHMSHTQNTHVAAPSYGLDAFARPQAFAAPLNPASFTRCFGCPSPPPLPYLAPDPSRSHARRGSHPRLSSLPVPVPSE